MRTCERAAYPEALEVAGLQEVPQVQDLSYGAFLLLRHCSQGNRHMDAPPPQPTLSLPTPTVTHRVNELPITY